MKSRILPLLAVAGLAIAGPLAAHVVSGPSILAHAHPAYEAATTVYKLREQTTGDVITVTWAAIPACPSLKLIQEYKVTIERTQATPAVYSLWTLGLQGVDTGTTITVGTAAVQVAETVLGALRKPAAVELVTPAGLMADPANPSRLIVNDKQIWLMEFTGTTFTFMVKRYNRPGETRWTQPTDCPDASGHDNTPPG